MYKLVSIDMDGTLLNSAGEISEKNIISIKNAVDKGVKVVITTGRGIRAVTKFLEQTGLNKKDEYVITNNGVAIYSTKDLKCLRAKLVEGQEIIDLCKLGVQLGAKVLVYDYNTEGTIVLEDSEFSRFERDHIGMSVTIDPDYCDKITNENKAFKVLFAGTLEEVDRIQNNIPNHIRDKYTVVRTLPIVLELFNKECNKGNAVKELSSMFGISMDEVICIGDQQNDYEMIKCAGLGVAMGNAIDYIKDIADYVTDTNDNDGVSQAINKFVLEI